MNFGEFPNCSLYNTLNNVALQNIVLIEIMTSLIKFLLGNFYLVAGVWLTNFI